MKDPDTGKVRIVWDMETGDPDDYLTLLLLCGHPRVDLRAVTVTPGTPKQVGLVRRALKAFGLDVPVGAYNLDHPKQGCVSSWHDVAYGPIPESRDADPGGEVLCRCLDERTTLLTGAPLKNVGQAFLSGRFPNTGRWVAQGGFAGEGVVPPEKQLEKFRGMRICPTYNFNGDPKAALAALSCSWIRSKRLVSKNVCHGVVYDRSVHERVAAAKERSLSLSMIHRGMDHYLSRKPAGKKFHDPLAACCAIDEDIATWSGPVELFRERGQWGARPLDVPGWDCRIIVDYDRERFLDVLTEA